MNTTKKLKWFDDINYLAVELPKKHKNLFFQKNKDEFFKELAVIKGSIDTLSDYEIKLQIAKIVASIGDAHTSVPLQINLLLPLELYWFSDGIYVIAAPFEYKDILHCKIKKVDGLPIEDVISNLSSIISYENEAYLKSQLPKYFPAIELLYDLDIVNDIDSLELTFEDKKGDTRTLEIKSMPLRESREKLNLINKDIIDNRNLPLYRRYHEKNYWFQYIYTFKTVFFKYNVCRNMFPTDVVIFCSELIQFIQDHDITKLIIDLRNNFGGNSSFLDPFIEAIQHINKVNKKGSIFVIIGRETFSSALLNALSLKENTSAIFLGEPTGGKPNCYGEVQRFTLKNSKLIVCYSTKYYKIIEDDSMPSLIPDVNIALTIQNFINNEDPCFEYIMNNY